MRVLHGSDMPKGKVFGESGVTRIGSHFVLALVLAGAPVMIWLFNAPTLFIAVTAALAVTCVPLIIKQLLAGRTWRMAEDSSQIILNLVGVRPDELQEVLMLCLDSNDVESISGHEWRLSIPDALASGTEYRRYQWMEISLARPVPDEVLASVEGPAGSRALGGIDVISPTRVRVLWRAFGFKIVPNLQDALRYLASRWPVRVEVVRSNERNWRELTVDEVERVAADLIILGDRFGAEYLMNSRGVSRS